MRLTIRILQTLCLCLSLAVAAPGHANEIQFDSKPVTNNGAKWRIGYYEGGEYTNYQKILVATVNALMKIGWMETENLPPQSGEETDSLWQWLATQAKSDYIEFVADAHYSARWNDDARHEMEKKLIDRLKNTGDIDLMIAMGTWAGKGLANDLHSTSTIVLSSSDPISAGIVKSVEDSGFDHVHATVDPKRYERQLRVFHEMIGFRRLGVIYEDSLAGRSYAAIETIESLAGKNDFEIVRCYTDSDLSDMKLAEEGVITCFDSLVNTADAIYVTRQGGVNARSIPSLVRIANEHKIPTFSQSGAEEVSYGFLASLSQAGYRYVGQFHAETMAKIFNGAKPNQLTQLYQRPPKIALNLKTAELIGFDPPVVLLGASDELFNEIIVPE